MHESGMAWAWLGRGMNMARRDAAQYKQVLYIYGGVYLDIKVVARHPLAEIFNSSTAHDRYTWYVCMHTYVRM